MTDRGGDQRASSFLASIVESTDDAIISKDLDGVVTTWNRGAERLYGYSAAEVVGRSIDLVIPLDQLGELPAILARLRRGERIENFETVRVRKDGQRIDVSVTISPINNPAGGVVGASAVARDISTRKRIERRLAAQHAITGVLAESASLEQAIPGILAATCECLGWAVGAFWLVDPRAGALRCAGTWSRPGVEAPRFTALTQSRTFAPGIGLPGRVWASREPVWIADVVQDDNFPRAPIAELEGLHAAFGFPVVLEGEVLGVVEFFSSLIQRPDEELLAMMTSTGGQLGQFIRRRRAEQAQRESEARKAAVLDTALDAIITIDHEGKILEFNPAAERIFGYRRNEVLGREMAELIVPMPQREAHRRGLAHFLATGEGPALNRRLEMTALRFDGSEFPVELAITRLSSDGPPLFTGYIRDITDRIAAAQALRQANEQLRIVTDSMSAPVTRCSRDLRYLWVNKQYADMLGRPPEQIIGRPIEEIVGRDAFAELRPYFERVLAGETVSYEQAVTFQGVGRRWITAVYSPTFNGRHEPDGWVAVIIDLTQRKEAEESLKEMDRRKDELLATLAHELRNPLAPILSAVEVLKAKESPGPELAWSRDIIDRQVRHMARLLDDLLDVNRMTRDWLHLRRELVELAPIVETAVETSRPVIDGRGHDLVVDLPPQAIRLNADPTRLAQVFSNLLNNAAKYTDPGGRIALTVHRQGRDAVISVRDTGVGIAKEHLPRIFELFSQAAPPLERSHGGLGIGLSLASRLVELHGGQIEAHSDGPGLGSAFIVRLPIESAASPQTVRKPSIAPPRASGSRILVADDLEDCANTLAKMLQLMGSDVRTAYDGDQAVALAEAFRPDVVLLDLGMPKLNGFEAARRIREQSWGKEMLLVAVTGWGQEEDRRRTSAAGFDHHLVKPVDPAAILRLVMSAPVD